MKRYLIYLIFDLSIGFGIIKCLCLILELFLSILWKSKIEIESEIVYVLYFKVDFKNIELLFIFKL